VTKRHAVPFAATVALVAAADQVTKVIVRSSMDLWERIVVVDGLFWLTRISNTGGAFGMLRGKQWLFVGTAVLILLAIAYAVVRLRIDGRWERLALALVAGGAIGNLIDRVAFGGVTDFFDLGWFPIFNVADIALDVGVAILVVSLLFGKHADPVSAEGDEPVEAIESDG